MTSPHEERDAAKLRALGISKQKEPVWLPYETAITLLLTVQQLPTLWLSLGIQWKYFRCRVDARTGDMLIYAGNGDDGWEPEYLNVKEVEDVGEKAEISPEGV